MHVCGPDENPDGIIYLTGTMFQHLKCPQTGVYPLITLRKADMMQTNSKTHAMVVVGTRPEAIKMAPVIRQLKEHAGHFQTTIVATAQHRQMMDQALSQFQIKPDIDLNVMRAHQSLYALTCRILKSMEMTLRKVKPDIVLVQGDTTTVLAGALAAFYRKIPVAAVESGLRSHDLYNPFPEEVNRRLATVMTEIHFAPTPFARNALLRENIPRKKIVVTGNTVVDALQYMSKIPFSFGRTPFAKMDLEHHRIVLVTSHRRESWGKDFENICMALKKIVRAHSDVLVIFPVHLNPVVRDAAYKILGRQERICLTEPLDYLVFVNLMKKAYLILTDSGGLQEEAPTFGKPLLVMRDVTERPEAASVGLARVVGTKTADIVREAFCLLNDRQAYAEMAGAKNPYGDGRAAGRIVEVLMRWAAGEKTLCKASEEFRPR